MSKTLIVNLRRIGDIYSSAHLISSMKRNDPGQKISILVYREFEKAAKSLAHIEHVYTIDRKAISTIMLNDLFSDGFAIQMLTNEIAKFSSENWSRIMNFSNDSVGTHITSYLANVCKAKVLGTYINENKAVEYNNSWGWIFNDYLTSCKNSPLSFLDCYTRMADIPPANMGNKIRTIKKHDESALKNINMVRHSIGSDGVDIKIIGLQIFASTADKSFSEEYTISLINTLLSTSNYCPVIFYGPFDEEREFVKRVNSKFNNAIVSAESDLLALPSLVQQMDAVITPDTAIKHLADCLEVPVIEIAKGTAPLFKQSTMRENNYLLTPVQVGGDVPTSDVKNTLDVLFAYSDWTQLSGMDHTRTYKVKKDALGTNFIPITGSFNWQNELYRLSARSYIARSIAKTSIDTDFVFEFRPRQKDFMTWMDKERKVLTSVTKNLLNVLRLTLKGASLPNFGRSFVNGLDLLLTYCDSEAIAAIPVIELRASLEMLENSPGNNNVSRVEELLYKMKNRLQLVHNVLKDVESKTTFNRGKGSHTPRIESV